MRLDRLPQSQRYPLPCRPVRFCSMYLFPLTLYLIYRRSKHRSMAFGTAAADSHLALHCACVFFLSLILIRGNYTNLHVLYTIARLPIRPASWPFHTVQGFFFFPPSPVFLGIYMVRMTGFLSGMENMGLGNRWTDGAGMGWDGIIRLGFFWA